MGFLDKLMGHDARPQPQPEAAPTNPVNADEAALARYRYMLQTAPPEAIEQAHAEAFAKLTPQQRQTVLQQLSAAAPPHERVPASDDPQTLARMATRAEIREPGIMERMFGGTPAGGSGIGAGGLFAGSLLTSLAGGFIGSAIADHFFRSTPMGQAFGGYGGLGMPGETYEGMPEHESHAHHSDDSSSDDSTDDSDDSDDSADDDSDDSADDSFDDSGGSDDSSGGDDFA